ncbi:MAG TPA: efflux RND transporter periplasmic adaptor subunit [Candidatus Acidoferrales bacterium]|nr:efflux RND transporter periplasmic adaptor subunit [Candidatus Acidoferrales bacterium]
MTRRVYSVRIFFLSMALAGLILNGCGKPQGEQRSQSNSFTSTTPVEVATVQRQTLSVTKQFSGTLEGEEQANIVAKISERIIAINVHVSDAVSSGQVLVELDKSGATSQFYQAQAGFNNAQKTYDRMKALYQEGAISQQSLDGAETAYEVAKANFDAAKSAVELTTPIPGVVTAVNVNVGDLTAPGSVLITVAKIGRMKVDFDVNEVDLGNLPVGHRVEVYSEARPGVKISGEIIQLSKSADVRSRTFQMKALFINTSDNWFRPGMFCRVNVPISSNSRSIVVPVTAIVSDGITNRVFLVRDGRSFQQNVQLGVTDGKNTEILAGLSEGDVVVTTGATNARDSGYVSIANK